MKVLVTGANGQLGNSLRAIIERPAAEGIYFSQGFAKNQIPSAIATPTRSDNGVTYHFTDEGECTWYEFAREIALMAGHTDCDIQPCTSDEFPSKVHRPAYSVLDKSRIKQALSIDIPHWKSSLRRCLERLDYLQSNPTTA